MNNFPISINETVDYLTTNNKKSANKLFNNLLADFYILYSLF